MGIRCRIAEQLWSQQLQPHLKYLQEHVTLIIPGCQRASSDKHTTARLLKLHHKTLHPESAEQRSQDQTMMAPATTHHLYPPFPAELSTAPLVSVSLAKLEASDGAESKAFFNACRSLGFFYLDTTGSPLGRTLVAEAEQLNDLQANFFKLPNQQKEEYAREKVDPFFGYRHGDLGTCHDDGTPKRNESYNVRSL